MPIGNSKELFVKILNNARKDSVQSAKAYRQFSEAAESFDLKQVLEARAFITENEVKSLEQCFERIGEKPIDPPFRLEEALVYDFKTELAQIPTSEGRQLCILAEASELALRSIAEYPTLISAAEVTGHHAVGALLEAILAHKMAFMEQDRRFVRDLVEGKIAESGGLAALQRAA